MAMNIKKCIFSLLLGFSFSSTEAQLPDSTKVTEMATEVTKDSISLQYIRNIQRYERFFKKLIPTYSVVQYAGSIGMVSVGLGWNYFHQRWRTELLFGVVPKFESENTKYILTLKEIYDPFRINIGKRFCYRPLQTGLFFSYIFGGEFWDHEPKRYPKHYYGFSTGFRINLLLGGQVTYNIPINKRRAHKDISLYYELSTCDLYLCSAFTNKNITLADILSLGFGVRMDIF